MTIDDAIAHAREKAKEQRYYANFEKNTLMYRSCVKCAEEHEQLAEWLEELKAYKSDEFTSGLQQLAYHQGYSQAESDYFENKKIDREGSYKIGHEIGYNKAIDDFAKEIYKMIVKSENNGNYRFYAVEIKQTIADLAEQLKAGVENEN